MILFLILTIKLLHLSKFLMKVLIASCAGGRI